MHAMLDHVRRIGAQARRLVAIDGVSRAVAAAVVGVLAWCLLDYGVRLQDRGLRLIGSLAVVALAAWALWRFAVPALRFRLDDIGVARRIERQFPELTDRLSSSVDFLLRSEDDPTAGSPQMRRAVISETAADLEQLDWKSVLDRRRVWPALLAAAASVSVAAALALSHPAMAGVAVQRLLLPFGNQAWPRQHRLAFKAPVRRVALGQTFEVELIDQQGAPPRDARIVYEREKDGQAAEQETESFQILAERWIARKENVTRPFRYRAIGGDDETMDWITVEVVEPPLVESVSVRLFPPAYTGIRPHAGERRIQAWKGTGIELVGRASRPIAAAVVHQEHGPSHPLQVAADGMGISLPFVAPVATAGKASQASDSPGWVAENSGKYWIELVDRDGLAGGSDDRWDLKVTIDSPPQVTIEQPTGNLTVTPRGIVPLRGTIRDDLAVARATLRYRRSDRKEADAELSVELYRGPAAVAASNDLRQPGFNHPPPIRVSQDWDLAPLELAAGTEVTLTLEADDYLPQSGVSQSTRLSIITPQELEGRLSQRQQQLAADLARILRMQQEARLQTAGLYSQSAEVRSLRKQDIDQLHAAELAQRQVRRSLASPTEGLSLQTAALLQEIAANRLDSPELARRIEQVDAELRRLDQNELASAESELVAALKNGEVASQQPQADGAEIARVAQSLSTTLASQDGVIGALERLVMELGEFHSFRQVVDEVSDIQREQLGLERRTRDALRDQPDLLGREPKDLTPQQRGDLQRLTERQLELARRFEKLQQRMAGVRDALQTTAPLSAEALADALTLAEREAVGGKMRAVGAQLEENRLLQAVEQQASLAALLAEIMDTLSNRRQPELSRLARKLRAAEAQLASLAAEQQQLTRQFQSLSGQDASTLSQQERKTLERLARQQEELQQRTKRFADELQRLQANDASNSSANAADHQTNAKNASDKGQSAQAKEQSQRAEQALAQAQQELAERRRQAEQDLADLQLAGIEPEIANLVQRQERAIQEAERLEKLAQGGPLAEPARQSLRDLAQEESLLADETNLLRDKVALEVFRWALESAASSLARSAEWLAQEKTGLETQHAQRQALVRLRQVAAAISAKPNDQANSDPPAGQGGKSGGQQPPPPAAARYKAAEIRLLRAIQQDVQTRTLELAAKREAGNPTAEWQPPLEELAEEQRRLVELAEQIISAANEAQLRAAEQAERNALAPPFDGTEDPVPVVPEATPPKPPETPDQAP